MCSGAQWCCWSSKMCPKHFTFLRYYIYIYDYICIYIINYWYIRYYIAYIYICCVCAHSYLKYTNKIYTMQIIHSGPPFGTQKLVPTLFLIHIFGKRASFQEAPWNEHIFFQAHLFLFSLCFYMTQLFWSVWFLSCWRDAGSAMLSHAWTKNKSNMHWYALVNLSNCTVNRMLTGWGQFVYLLFAQRVKG